MTNSIWSSLLSKDQALFSLINGTWTNSFWMDFCLGAEMLVIGIPFTQFY
jgi:hypothetical protein